MNREAELERVRLFTAAARQRIRRLDVLLDEQVRILELDPTLKGQPRRSRPRESGYRITTLEMRVFAVTFVLASVAALLAGYWSGRFRML